MMWVLAKGYHFQPEAIEEMYLEDMVFWITGLNWIHSK